MLTGGCDAPPLVPDWAGAAAPPVLAGAEANGFAAELVGGGVVEASAFFGVGDAV
jgi:hypothetical protein